MEFKINDLQNKNIVEINQHEIFYATVVFYGGWFM